MRHHILASLVVFAAGSLARGQEIKNPAQLFPAGSFAYAEVRQPGALAKEIRGLVEDSVLGNVPDSLQKFRAKNEDFAMMIQSRMIASFGLALSPEVVKELQRVQGAGLAMTGIGQSGEPEWAAVVLPGDSNIPNFLMRGPLAMQAVRRVDTVEDVPLYRVMYRHYYAKPATPDKDKFDGPQFKENVYGPTFAHMPGLVVLGSTDAVKDVIRRAKGKGQGPVLADDKQFRDASDNFGTAAGVFAYASPPAAAKVLADKGKFGFQMAMYFELIKNITSATWSVTLEQGALRVRETIALDPAVRKQMAALLPNKAVDPSLFQYAPRDAVLAVGLANPDGAERWRKLLEILDETFPPIQGKKVSELLKDVENQVGIDAGKDVLGSVTNVAMALGDPTRATVRRVEEKGEGFHSVSEEIEIPFVVIVQATDEQTAGQLQALLTKVFAMQAREKVERSTQTVAGIEVTTIKGRREYGSVGRRGRILVFGPYAGPVIAALVAGEKKEGLLSDLKLTGRLRELDDPFMVVLAKPIGLLTSLVLVSGDHSSHGTGIGDSPFDEKKGEKKEKTIDKKLDVPRIDPAPKQENPVNEQVQLQKEGVGKKEPGKVTRTETVNPRRDPEEERVLKEMSKLLSGEDWFVLGVTRKEDRIVADGKATLGKTIARLIDFGIEELARERRPHFETTPAKKPPFVVGEAPGNPVFTTQDKLTANDPKDRVRQGTCKIYNVKLQAGRTYQISMTSGFDNYLRIEDAAGKQLAIDDDSGGNLNARIVFLAPNTDTYRIVATAFSNGMGEFRLSVVETKGP